MNKEMLALFILVLGFGFVEFVVPKILRAIRKTKDEDEKPAKTIVVECGKETMIWHTGMPTLEGWYLIKLKSKNGYCYVIDSCSYINDKMTWSNDKGRKEYSVVGWRPVEIIVPIIEGRRCTECSFYVYDENNSWHDMCSYGGDGKVYECDTLEAESCNGYKEKEE